MDTSYRGINNQEQAPWGFFTTIGFSFVIIFSFVIAQIFVSIGFIVVAGVLRLNIDPYSLQSNGLLLATSTLVTTPLIVTLSLLFAKLRKKITIKEYFCLHKPGKEQFLKWLLALLVLAVCSDALSIILDKPIVPDFMVNAYLTAYFTPLLWFALIIAGPLGEEFLFRGFLFKGIQSSRIGHVGAIFLSSLGWSAMHVQYDLYGIATVFAGGILLGFARFKSNSIYVPFSMHALWSFIATIEIAFHVRTV